MVLENFFSASSVFLLLGIFFNLFTLALFLYHNFFVRGLLVKHTVRNCAASSFFILVLLLNVASGLYIFLTSAAAYWLGVPYCVAALAFLFLYIWFLNQLGDSENLSTEVLQTITGVIEAGDPNLEGHSINVHNLSMLLYDYLPLKYRRRINVHSLRYASLLLDVGKLGIPRAIIQKPGKLTEEEYALIQRHPEIGASLLNGLPNFQEVRLIIKCHHERVDGAGYLGLKKEQIPLASRLLAVTDTYSAITMERSYRASMPYQEAIGELRQSSGGQLDSELVEIFASIPLKKIQECLDGAQGKMKKYEVGDFK